MLQSPVDLAQSRTAGWNGLPAVARERPERVLVFRAGGCCYSYAGPDSDAYQAQENFREHRRDSTFGVDRASSDAIKCMLNP